MMAGSEMEMVGVMGKSKETTGLEAEMVVGTESGGDTEAGMDSEVMRERTCDRWWRVPQPEMMRRR